jgi:gliding motility-associated-like protein
MKLSWTMNIPWVNYQYTIYRKNLITGIFDSIGTSSIPYYVDKDLKNGILYCYYVKTIGSYSITNIVNPIINLSEQSCAAPIDNEAPCPPKLTVTPDCQQPSNTLDWINTDSCDYDIKKYYIWYTPNMQHDLDIIAVYEDPSARKYIHFNISSVAGCYAISAIDSNNNVGSLSNLVCIDIDSCMLYYLPNMFSPNGDGINDLLKPYPYQGVEKIDLSIYNRWGTKVFGTTNPDINWDGKDQYSHKDCSDGVYFYVCDVYELRLKGEIIRQLHGSITILR